MGLVIPKPILQWKQPKDFDRMVVASTLLWVRVARRVFSFTLALGFCFFLWHRAKSNPNVHLLTFEQLSMIAIPFAFFMTFGVPWLHSLQSHRIGFYDGGVGRSGHGSGAHWKYKDILGWMLVERSFQGETLRILALKHIRGGVIAIGVTDTVTKEQIARVFTDKNVGEIPIQTG